MRVYFMSFLQPQPHLIGAETVAGKPRQLRRLLAFLDPLVGSSALVVEPHHRRGSARSG
jgi:hypothetical protein